MNLSGTWTISETWQTPVGPVRDSFSATFNPQGTVTITGSTAGFAMVWYTGAQPEQQGVILAGDNSKLGILAAYYGTIEPGGNNMSGTTNGKMIIAGAVIPVTGTWEAVQTSSQTAGA